MDEVIFQTMVDLIKVGVMEMVEAEEGEEPDQYVRRNGKLRLTEWGHTASNADVELRALTMGITLR